MSATTTSALLAQILPLLILILAPALALRLFAFARARFRFRFPMALRLLPWHWGSGSSEIGLPHGHEREGERGKTRRVRTGAGQRYAGEKGRVEKADALFPGLVNMSGTHCFMNSTLQALASLSSLPPYLLAIRTRAEALDVPTPVVDALLDLLSALNTPSSSAAPLRATALVEALCAPPPLTASGSTTNLKASALLATHEHQDAQELFQLLSEAVREDAQRVAREGARSRGLALAVSAANPNALASPFDGLTATRRACVRCGYTAAIRHFAFDSVQLALGGAWGATSLHALLRAYTALEVLHDCPCRRCALRATARRLGEEAARLEGAPVSALASNGMIVDAGGGGAVGNGEKARGKEGKDKAQEEREKDAATEEKEKPTPSRLRRLKAVRRMEARVLRALEARRIEEEELDGWDWAPAADGMAEGTEGGGGGGGGGKGGRGGGKAKGALDGVRIERVAGGVCTRQSMVGRPPAILALHINRSVHTGLRAAKNSAPVAFPAVLDLAPYTTGGVLRVEPAAALSGGPIPTHLAPTSAPHDAAGGREGEGEGEGEEEEEGCVYRLAAAVCHFGQHAFGHYICYRRAPSGWLRISDARVERCGVEAVLAEGRGVFMLYYERVPPASPALEPRGGVCGRDSAGSVETMRPGAGAGAGMWGSAGESVRAKARVVRSVSVGVGVGVGVGSSSSARSTASPAPVRAAGEGEDGDGAGDADRGENGDEEGDGEGEVDARALSPSPSPSPPPSPSPSPEADNAAAEAHRTPPPPALPTPPRTPSPSPSPSPAPPPPPPPVRSPPNASATAQTPKKKRKKGKAGVPPSSPSP
ncbi:hypothetical protein DFH07DRAFT_985524 [Mycena maculata]|uniref:ubiquitinyl hydrolase 1 n=1 Tax=Mycena maculata TaxID=230809 RepID=A0AAD7I8X2_9AGAR|nr:hypothetical protein DFH07DRAFT_985524 [Mycena maculata]